jgi:nucleoside-diphosphate-sugar epimerase
MLVTGGAGFIGSTVVNALSQVSCRVVVLLRAGRHWDSLGETEAEIVALNGDILDRQTWSKALAGVDHVFHIAGQTSAYVANEDPQADLDANVVPLLQMLNVCRAEGLKPAIMFAGTATQAGLPTDLPVNETVRDLPVTVYDVNKLAGEKYLQCFTRETGIPTATLRLSNVYGPGTSVGRGDRGILNLMVKKALNKEPLTVYGDGNHVRDYIFIDDVASAFLTAGAASDKVSGNYYVIGSGEGYKIVDAIHLVADQVESILGYRPEVRHVPTPEGMSLIEDRDFVADTSLFRSSTGWTPQISLEEGIDRTIKYAISQTPDPPELPR